MKKVFSKIVRTGACLSLALGLALSVSLVSASIGEVEEAVAAVGGSPNCPLKGSIKKAMWPSINTAKGNLKVGKKYTAKVDVYGYTCAAGKTTKGKIDGKAVTFAGTKKLSNIKSISYQWLYSNPGSSSDKKISKATGKSFTPTKTLEGKNITLSVTIKKAGMKTIKNYPLSFGSVASTTKSSKFASSNSCSGKYIHKEKGQCYYTWEQAKNACTNGTHLPTKAELQAVIKSGEYKKWPKAGFYYPEVNDVDELGSGGLYWSVAEYNSGNAWDLYLLDDATGELEHSGKLHGLSVRCVK